MLKSFFFYVIYLQLQKKMVFIAEYCSGKNGAMLMIKAFFGALMPLLHVIKEDE